MSPAKKKPDYGTSRANLLKCAHTKYSSQPSTGHNRQIMNNQIFAALDGKLKTEFNNRCMKYNINLLL